MAFVNVNIALGRPSLATRRSTCVRTPVMSADFSRRQMLRAAGVAFGLTVVADVARAFDLKELKEDVEEIKYDEEVQEIGPDSKEELILRQKKEQKEDPTIAAEREREKQEEAKYEEVVAREQSEAAKLKAEFEKRFKN